MGRRTDIHSILVIGSGPIVIGQACEFDYSGTQACRVLREEGYRVVLANSNPATIMTDPDFADATYIEPLTASILTQIIEAEKPDALLPTLGGQTALNLAMELEELGVLRDNDVEMIGADATAIATAEDRSRFKDAMIEIGLDVPRSGIARSMEEAHRVLDTIDLPVIIRPAYILGGRGTGIAAHPDQFVEICRNGLDASPIGEILDRGIDHWVEGVRAGGDAGSSGQSGDHLRDRERRPDGCAHRRFDHGGTDPNPDRCRVSEHAGRCVCGVATGRGGDRRFQRPVRRRP